MGVKEAVAVDLSKKNVLEKLGVCVQPVKVGKDGYVDLKAVLKNLGGRGITSVLVEGGSKIHASFIQHKLADQAYLFFAPIFIGGDGISVTSRFGLENIQEAQRLTDIRTKRFNDDILINGLF